MAKKPNPFGKKGADGEVNPATEPKTKKKGKKKK